jgi:hypothetical protein
MVEQVAKAGNTGSAALVIEGERHDAHAIEYTERFRDVNAIARRMLTSGENAISDSAIDSGAIRIGSVLYMAYWQHRLQHNTDEQGRIRTHLAEYIGTSSHNASSLCDRIFRDAVLRETARDYVEGLLLPVKTVDLVVTRQDGVSPDDRYVLCAQRSYYPKGSALPGGIVTDADEANTLGLRPDVFAALRVAGEKILGGISNVQYGTETGDDGRIRYVVSAPGGGTSVVIHPEDCDGYRFRENIRTVLRPSDPRHIVDTVGFRCELRGDPPPGLTWKSRAEVLSAESPAGGFVFNHHREIVSHIIARTSVSKERNLKERDFIRSILKDPLGAYEKLRSEFSRAKYPRMVSRPELFPVVDRLLEAAYTPEMNKLCVNDPILAGIRDKVTINLRQVSLKNRVFCPYVPTLNAIADGIAFFDVVARHKKGFYEGMPKDAIVEHNPAETPHASYHMYRYKYRLDELLCRAPDEILIPTFEPLSATDLMRVRGVPIRFLGLSTDFIYVDEFDQSPEEFMMHDANHSWRMMAEDDRCESVYNMSREELIAESMRFSKEYLDRIKILPTDPEEVRELKKLKKIILFEIVHEDARPFLRDVVCAYIQQREGSSVPFEVPHIDPETGYMDIVDTMDTGISTLSYVRNKLQHGFYDHVDAQMPQIVSPEYRTSTWIARAAYEMLVELGAKPAPHAELDAHGYVAQEWLLKRVCSVGPDNIHDSVTVDPLLEQFGDGADRLNPKRYQA